MGGNPYKIRAYRKAAHVIQKHEHNLYILHGQNFDLTLLPSIGKGIAFLIQSFIETGSFPYLQPIKYQDVHKTIPKKPIKKSSALRLYHALPILEKMSKEISQIPGVLHAKLCGDYQRKQEVIVFAAAID